MFERNKEYKERMLTLLTESKYANMVCHSEMGGGTHVNVTLLSNRVYGKFLMVARPISTKKENFGSIVGGCGNTPKEHLAIPSISTTKEKKNTHEVLLEDVFEKFGDKMFSYSNGRYFIPTDIGMIVLETFARDSVSIVYYIEIVTWDNGNAKKLSEFITENFKLVDIPSATTGNNKYKLAFGSAYGLSTKEMPFRPVECDIKKNYNDDLPYDKISKLLSEPRQHLIMFCGAPGTGKTTLIKKIINDNPDKTTIVVDSNLLTTVGDDKLLNFLSANTDTILVLEDCDKILQSRERGNQTMATILNLTDGLIGEAFNIKFICTFNTDKNKVDPAVFRKGRLSLMYEFKPLAIEKTRAFIPDAKKEMTIAEIFNPDENQVNNNTSSSKIGF